MAFTEKRLAGPSVLTANTETTLYTCPTAQTTTTMVKQFVVTNTSASAGATFNLSLVPVTQTAGTANRLFNSLAIAANETILLDVSQVMTSGDFISARSSAGSTINVTISGIESAGGMVVSGLADFAVTTDKIADNAVTVNKIANTAVTSAKLADSLALTGTPTAPTATAGTNTTQLATTEFANAAGGLVFIKSQVIGSGVSSVQVTNAFSSAYDNYKIVVSGGASSQQTSIYMILGASTGTYYGVYLYAGYASGTPQGAAINNQANFIYAGGADIAVLNVNIELQNPFLTKYTNIQALTVNYSSIRGTATGEHETASSYTSFTLAPYAGTLTGGTIYVYGYRK